MTAAVGVLASVAVVSLMSVSQAESQTWRTMTSERHVQRSEPVDVQISYGAGTLTLNAAEPPTLYRMNVSYDEEVAAPFAEFDERSRVLRLGVRATERTRRSIRGSDRSTASIALTREVPLDIDIEFGAGKSEIELGGLTLQRLDISTGASETTIGFSTPNRMAAERIRIESGAADLRVIGLGNARAERLDFQGGVGASVLDFSGAWEADAIASIQMGIGSVTLRLPRGSGVRLNRSSFLTSFSGPGLERRGNSYYSANWESAGHRITIEMSTALGSVNVEWVD